MPSTASPITDNVGRNIRALRTARGMTRQTLSEESHVSMRSLARIEAGEDCLITTLDAIAKALDVTPARLLWGDES
jgi:transcriptional regulator with XRE-family HTH domain